MEASRSQQASEVRFHEDPTSHDTHPTHEQWRIEFYHDEEDDDEPQKFNPKPFKQLQLQSWRDPPPVASPKSDQVSWHSLPSDLIAHIATMLDLKSLTRMSRIDSLTSQTIAKKDHIWSKILTFHPPFKLASNLPEKIFAKQFVQASERLQLSPEKTPRAYIMTRQRIAIELIGLLERRAIAHENQKQREKICDYLTGVSALGILLVILIPIFLISLLVQSMRGDHSITFVTFWPIYALIFYITVVTTFFCWLHWFRGSTRNYMGRTRIKRDGLNDDELNNWIVSETFSDQFDSPIGSLVGNGGVSSRTYTEPTIRGHAYLCLTLMAFAIWIVLITLRMTRTIDTSWTIVFIPIYFAFGCCLISPFLAWMKSFAASLLPMSLAVWFIASVVLLHLRFLSEDSDDTNGGILLVYVFFPLFLWDLIWFVFFLCGALTTSRSDLRNHSFCRRIFGTATLSIAFKVAWVLYTDFDHLVPIWSVFALAFALMAFIVGAILWPWPDDD